MQGEERYSTGLWIFGPCPDRFCVAGYRKPVSLETRFKLVAGVKAIRGVETLYPSNFEKGGVDTMKTLLRSYKLKASMVCVDIYSNPKWMYGCLTSLDEEVRKEAVQIVKEAMDVAFELESMQVNFWAGQDGYDYLFQTDYGLAWKRLVDGLKNCAEYRPDVRLCIEYKIKEPRTHIFIGTVGKALLLANQVGLKNVGVTLDVGHALMAGENLAESAVLLNQWGRLFHLHFNDNYRDWDHDMVAGSVNPWDYLELLLWLQVIGYDGWYSLDICPYREDPVKACEESIRNIDALRKIVQAMDAKELTESIRQGDIMEIQPRLREAVLRVPQP